ncbi:MAG: glycosyltransferase family 2 protein [Saprospiraceae bacterium]|nr:glycosyltransferase family 2 protein [Saprospiraceae bacterium]
MTSLDIILPAYNPLPGWEEIVIGRFQSLVKALPDVKIRLFIVNDGSLRLDESQSEGLFKEVIPDLQWVSYKVNRGKGYALRQGVAKSTADFIVYTDIDWPYTEESMIGVIRSLIASADAVIGKRNEDYYTYLPPARRRISRLLRNFNAKLLRLRVDDTQAGLKGFRKHIKEIFLSTTIDRYLFDLEFIYLISAKQEINVIGYPIALRPGITFSKMNRKILFQEARNFLKIWMKG